LVSKRLLRTNHIWKQIWYFCGERCGTRL